MAASIDELAAKKKEDRDRAKRDRLFLANEVLGYDFSPDTHAELFAQYPEFKEGIPWSSQFPKRDVLVLWPRGHFKTTALVVLVIQAILVNPDIRVLLMQGSIKVARNLLKEIASHFLGTAKGSRLHEVFYDYCGKLDPETNEREFGKKALGLTLDQFTTPARKKMQLAQATVTVASPKAVKTGQHYDLGVFDDLVNDSNYRSPTLLRRVQEDFDMCFPLVDPGCPRFVSGTRYAFGDLYEIILRRSKDKDGNDLGEWTISIKTCWKTDRPLKPEEVRDEHVRFLQFAGKDGNTHGFTKELLLQIMRDSPGIFASQYLNQPMLESQQIITEDEMARALVIPATVGALSEALIIVDLAAEGTTEPDDNVIIVGRVDQQAIIHVVGGSGDVWSIPDTATVLIRTALHYRPLKILIEETNAAKYFVEYVRMVCREKGVVLPIDFIKVDNRKDAKSIRIKAMTGHVKNNRLKFFLELSFWGKLVEQTKNYNGGRHRHDDYPDTVAMLCNAFAKRFLGLPVAAVPTTKHPMVAMLDRDPVSGFVAPRDQEFERVHSEGTLGDDFSC